MTILVTLLRLALARFGSANTKNAVLIELYSFLLLSLDQIFQSSMIVFLRILVFFIRVESGVSLSFDVKYVRIHRHHLVRTILIDDIND